MVELLHNDLRLEPSGRREGLEAGQRTIDFLGRNVWERQVALRNTPHRH
jgi:hypothetical protein